MKILRLLGRVWGGGERVLISLRRKLWGGLGRVGPLARRDRTVQIWSATAGFFS